MPIRPPFTCTPSSKFTKLSDLVDAIKANPGKLKASGTGQGGSWHLAMAGMLHSLKVDPNGRLGAEHGRCHRD